MKLVESISDLMTNIRLVEEYLSGIQGDEMRTEMIELIRRGNNFICYTFNDENVLQFVPSKYIGYKDNKISTHLFNRKRKQITGSKTDTRLDKLLGLKKADQELTEQYHNYCLKLGISEDKLTKFINKDHDFWFIQDAMVFPTIDPPTNTSEAEEGEIKEALHKYRERNRAIIREKKAAAKGKLQCEVCGFNFSDSYGEFGNDFIEVHHITPVAEMRFATKTKLEDLILICSNCHSMIHHQKPCLSVTELKSLLK